MINPAITAIIAREEPTMIAFRRDLHAHPELPWRRSAPRIASPPNWTPSESLTGVLILAESSPISLAARRVKPWPCVPIWMPYRCWS